MKFVSRKAWGAKPSRYNLVRIASTRGVKVHYEGTEVPADLVDHHERCDDRVRAIQASHLANDVEDYSDIAYNAAVCPHGYVYEGRGAHHKTGANGNATLNANHYAVLALLGSKGLIKPTDAMLHGLRDAIEWLRDEGDAGTEILGHKDGYATQCPGKPLYTWVQAGAPRPQAAGGSKPTAGKPQPSKPAKPSVSLAKVVQAARTDPHAAQGHQTYAVGVRLVEKALLELGYLTSRYAGDGSFGSVTVTAYAAWQRHLGYSGTAADGIPGRTSLSKLGATTGLFTVTS
ncbi:N-acetylmuramoyl-L-alanine amidase [Actinacidiphila glaucinigra]|uniref:N-acetylmuramoyl-L-alanine amidase n=1 Tax=Actinacidiphila glaucinigra TaxID=235986 RepID=UPI002E37A748|nr:N-acetylmuramoyl-L-alanine amidase [Actinacidiphila glaucinigra]